MGVPIVAINSSVRRLLLGHGFPVTALCVGGLFLLNYIIFKSVGRDLGAEVRHGLNELKESNSALAFVWFGFLEWRRVAGSATSVAEPAAATPQEAVA